MAVTIDQVESQLYPFLNMKLTPKDRPTPAKRAFGENFNKMLTLAKQAVPNLDQNLWPSPITFDPNTRDCEATYLEIEVYANQIKNNLSAATPPSLPQAFSGGPSAFDRAFGD